jgi:polynucleotide 5'-kinase involved in rRNA processing
MDLDPGQPNYNLAGQLSLVRVKDLITTNSDFKDVEHVTGYYLNTPTPNLNMAYYSRCVEKLL